MTKLLPKSAFGERLITKELNTCLFKPDSFFRNDRMFLEPHIVVLRIIKTVVCATALKAGQCRSDNEQRGCVKVACLAGTAWAGLRETFSQRLQLLLGLLKSCAHSNDAHLVPHKLLNLTDKRFSIAGIRDGGRVGSGFSGL